MKIAKDHGIDQITGFYDYQDNIHEIMQQADIVLMCSRNEAFGRVTVEAMLAGKPVIGTSSGGTGEIIEHESSGFLYPPGNVALLSEKIEFFLKNFDKIEEFGRRGQALVETRFLKENYGGAIYRVLMELKGAVRYDGKPFLDFVRRLSLETALSKNPKQSEVSFFENKLNTIYASRGWRLLSKYYALRDKITRLLVARRKTIPNRSSICR